MGMFICFLSKILNNLFIKQNSECNHLYLYVEATLNKKKNLYMYLEICRKILEKSGKFVSPKKWETCLENETHLICR